MLKEADLWIDWTCEGALADLLDKVATGYVAPTSGADAPADEEAE